MTDETAFDKSSNNSSLFSFFIATLALLVLCNNYNHELLSFDKRMIGIATLEKIDISYRVRFFYKAIAIFSFVFILIKYLSGRIFSRLLTIVEGNVLEIVSFAGSFLIIFGFLGYNTISSYQLMVWLLPLPIMVSLIKKAKPDVIFSALSWFYCLVISFVLTFLLNILLKEFDVIQGLEFLQLFLPVFYLSVITFAFISSFELKAKLFAASAPLVFIPFFVTLSREIYLIMNQREIYLNSSFSVFLFLLIVSACISFFLFIRMKPDKLSQQKLNSRLVSFYLPVLIFGIASFVLYEPFYDYSGELFEKANPALGVQRFFLWNEIPLLESFNSHMFQELIPNFVYVFLNGHIGADMFLYDFFLKVIASVLIFIAFSKVINPYYAFALVLLMPKIFVHHNVSFSLIAIFFLLRLFSERSFKNYFMVTVVVGALFLYKIEIGLSSLYASLVTFLVISYLQKENFNPGSLIKGALAGILFFCIPALLICWVKGVPVIDNMLQALHYLDSAQTYGYTDIAYDRGPAFMIHYFVFPSIAILILVYFLYNISRYYSENRALFICIIFMIIYYLANFQRGTLRHSLIEGTDNYFNAYIYLIIPLSVYLLLKDEINNFISLALMTSLLIVVPYFFAIPPVRNSSGLLEAAILKFQKFPEKLSFSEKISRATNQGQGNKSYFPELKQFLDKNFPNKQSTFFDFSNTPMMYFFTERKVPVYFNQTLLTVHDDYLQDKSIEQIRMNNTVAVIFSHESNGFWDNVDQVPNTVRHYRLAEFIFQNYRPYSMMDGYNVWLRKDIELHSDEGLNVCKNFSGIFNLRYLPFIWANFDKKYSAADVLHNWDPASSNIYQLPGFDKSSGNYVKLDLTVPDVVNQYQCTITYGNGESEKGGYTFVLEKKDGDQHYMIRSSMQYNWFAFDNEWIKLVFNNEGGPVEGVKVNKIQLLKGD
ncbi:MAG: hypothetical protein ACK40G_07385 [Cytophagaceae bacterium]